MDMASSTARRDNGQRAAYASVEELLAGEMGASVHIECGRETVDRAARFVHERYQRRRCAFYLATDQGFDRETVRSYLTFFSRIAGDSVTASDAIAHFGLAHIAKTQIRKLSP